MEISKLNVGTTTNTAGIEKKKVEKDPADKVELRNGLLSEAVDKGTLSKDIADRIKELRSQMPSKKDLQSSGNNEVEQTKCYLPCYDGGPWFKENNEETAQTKCYLPCYDGGPWFKESTEPDKGFGFGTILCYRSVTGESTDKALPGGGPLCYAPMTGPEKSLPGGGPLCYAPFS